MVFYPPAWTPKLPYDPPDTVTIPEFLRRSPHEQPGRRNPFTCGLTGRTYTAAEQFRRTDQLSRALARELAWRPNAGQPWDKVVAVFAVNTIDYIAVTHAVHRLSGIASPANVAYAASELAHQLRAARARALFTCPAVLHTAREAARAAGIPDDRIFLLDAPGGPPAATLPGFRSVDDLIVRGAELAELEPLRWCKGQGARQVAYLCFSSGTSGLPKAVMISHRNVIANMMQHSLCDMAGRKTSGVATQTLSGLLPFSHIYGLVVVAHSGTWRGDEVIVLPQFDLPQFLGAIERFRINQLLIVPPIVVRMLSSRHELDKYDLGSVRSVFTGAAPLGKETIEGIRKLFPQWRVGQGYGLTETATVVTTTPEDDIVDGTSGCLVSEVRAKIIDSDGSEVTAYKTRGELLVQSPSVTLGYLNDEQATAEAFVWDDDGRWMRTGDEVMVVRSPAGHEHFVVVDRLKELIKVKGHQVAPAELEAHLLAHEWVDDVAVVAVPDERAGEVPKAFVVRAAAAAGRPDGEVREALAAHVEAHKARHKSLRGGVDFVAAVPKSPSGKILRRVLRDRERELRRKKGAKL